MCGSPCYWSLGSGRPMTRSHFGGARYDGRELIQAYNNEWLIERHDQQLRRGAWSGSRCAGGHD
jgi:hypothetical protein